MSVRNQILHALKWTILGRVATQLVTWGITIYVMRLLKPGDYGLIAMAAIFSELLLLIAGVGLSATLIQSKDLPPERLRQIQGLTLLSNCAACGLMAVVAAPLAALFFGEARLQSVMQVMALQFLPAAFITVPSGLLARDMRFRERAIVDFSSSLLGAILVLLLAWLGYGAFALAWGTVAQATIQAIGLNLLRFVPVVPVFRFAGCGAMFKFGRNVAATQLLFYFYSQADGFIAGKLLGKHSLGIYSVSMDLASKPASRASAILYQVVFPGLSRIQREGGQIGPYFLKGMRGVSLVSFPIMWGMSSVAPELVSGLLGEKWIEAVTPLALLCLIMPFRVLSPVVHSALYAVGRADVSLRVNFITAVTMCAAFLVGVQFDLIGLSLAWVIAFPLVFMFNLLVSRHHLGLTAVEILTALARPALAAGLTYGAVALVRPWLWDSPLETLGILIVVGILAYAGATFAFNRAGLAEARNMMRWQEA